MDASTRAMERGRRMNTYLTIITTALVLTQIIRITQNHISLRRQNKLYKGQMEELLDIDIRKEDFETQRDRKSVV